VTCCVVTTWQCYVRTLRCHRNYHGRVSKTIGTPTLTAGELAVWRIFLRVHASLTSRLEHDLLIRHDLPLGSYDVLVQLAEAPQRQLRMTDLADRVLLSRSGLTRLVDRLTAEGLVERQSCPSDARGTFTVLTAAGLTRLREAAPTHLRGIEDYMTRRLEPAELDALGDLLAKLLPEAGREPPISDCGAAVVAEAS
jgi:DNA-binding MarR family transcriptional regulator